MLKKFWYGIAFLSVAFICAGVTTVTMNARQAKAKTSSPAAVAARVNDFETSGHGI